MFRNYRFLLFFIFFSNHSFGQSEIRFKNYTINDGLSQSSALCIIQDDLNSLWIGTQDGLNRFDGKTFEVFTSDETSGLESEYIRCAIKDKEGNLWFGTNNGLTVYNKQTEKFTTYTFKNNETLQIEDISIGKDKEIWISSVETGVYSFNRTSKKFKSHIVTIPSKKTTKIFCTPSGKVLVSSRDKGVFFYDSQSNTAKNIELKQEATNGFSNHLSTHTRPRISKTSRPKSVRSTPKQILKTTISKGSSTMLALRSRKVWRKKNCKQLKLRKKQKLKIKR